MEFLSLSELMIIILIALIVLGPKKTVEISFYLGTLFAKAKSYLNKVKREIDLSEISKMQATVKANDFSCVLEHQDSTLNPQPTKASTSNKKMWTVDESSFKESKSTEDATSSLQERVLKLEQQIAVLEKQLNAGGKPDGE